MSRKLTKGRTKARIEYGINPFIEQAQKRAKALKKRTELAIRCLNRRNFGESQKNYDLRMQYAGKEKV